MQVTIDDNLLPDRFQNWFKERGWQPRSHQLELLSTIRHESAALLTAPTGGGKTLAGFLPALTDISQIERKGPRNGPHTIYVSPLKALAVDIARNLEMPVSEMGLDIGIETRTGDTPASRKQRQRYVPPDFLLTTPEQISLLLAHPTARRFFQDVKYLILDELHALVTSKRGDLLSLATARLRKLAPEMKSIGLSATIEDPEGLSGYLVSQPADNPVHIVRGKAGTPPVVNILASEEYVPWAGHMARHTMGEVYEAIKGAGLTLVFVNTRRQAEVTFQDLWHLNDDNLEIALHHGSLAVEQRRKVESAMAAGKLRAVVCTSTLDLGIDWGEVDLVIHVGAPKGASRLLQRIGRANHRMDEPSRALLVPSNRFEVLECEAAKEAAEKNELDGEPLRQGALDVLAQHILGMACAEPFLADDLFDEARSALPYKELPREDFDRLIDFVATGGYSLRAYDRYKRLTQNADDTWRVSHPSVAQRYRMNVGTIVEAETLKVRIVRQGRKPSPSGNIPRGGRVLGEIEEYFIDQLKRGDTFVFAGEVLAFEGIRENECIASRAQDRDPMVPAYQGGKFPLSTFLAARVREMVADPDHWKQLPHPVSEWLGIQKWRSQIPGPDELLIETFPRAGKSYMVCYPFDGRLAHQSLGMLITRRLERMGTKPLGFVASEYALSVWALKDLSKIDFNALFDEDMLGDDLESWLAETSLMKRTFRNCAIISGLIERRFRDKEKTGRQVTISSDLIYDVLAEHEPDHILLKATWADVAGGFLDIARLGELLARVKGHLRPVHLDRVSPLAVPVMLEIGREPVAGEANEVLLQEVADDLIEEATRLV